MTDAPFTPVHRETPPPRLEYVALLKAAKAHVAASTLYRRFISGTPLENDIAVWMADHASEALDAGLAEQLRAIRAALAEIDRLTAENNALKEQMEIVEAIRESDGYTGPKTGDGRGAAAQKEGVMSDWTETRDDYFTMMRGMYAEARLRFRELVEPHISTEEEREHAESLTAAIGEVSPEEAVAAFLRWKLDAR